MTRAERLATALLLSALLLVRLWLIRNNPLHLYATEEFAHLRLYEQLRQGLPAGPLSQYAYGDGRGLNGGGSLVLSVLYLAVAPLVGAGEAAVRTMATLWALAGAGLVAALGRRLLGPWGGVAALAALIGMPPSYWIHTCVAWGNHAEGGVLVLGAALLVHRGLHDGQRWMLAGAAQGGFAVFFWPPAALFVAPLAAVGVAGTEEARGRLAVLTAGAVGFAPWLLTDFEMGTETPELLVAALGRDAWARLADPGALVRDAAAAWGAVPLYDVRWVDRPVPGPAFRLTVAPLLRLAVPLGWLACMAQARARRGAGVLAALVLGSLLLPPLLALPGELVPRRVTALYPVAALGLAALLTPAWSRSRLVGAAGALGLVALAWPTAQLAAAGGRPDAPFRPEAYALCPGSTPALSSGTCVRDLSERHLPVLSWIDADPRIERPAHRKAALLGVDAAAGSAWRFLLVRSLAPCPDQHVRVDSMAEDPAERTLAWEAFGASLAVSCGFHDATFRCIAQAPRDLLPACRRGVDRVLLDDWE